MAPGPAHSAVAALPPPAAGGWTPTHPLRTGRPTPSTTHMSKGSVGSVCSAVRSVFDVAVTGRGRSPRSTRAGVSHDLACRAAKHSLRSRRRRTALMSIPHSALSHITTAHTRSGCTPAAALTVAGWARDSITAWLVPDAQSSRRRAQAHPGDDVLIANLQPDSGPRNSIERETPPTELTPSFGDQQPRRQCPGATRSGFRPALVSV